MRSELSIRLVRGLLPMWAALLVAGGPRPLLAQPAVQVGAAETAFVQALHAQWYLPRSVEFAEQAQRLQGGLAALCRGDSGSEAAALAASRAQWRTTIDSWERLAAVRGGALLARRSPREIDFMPTRPEAIRRAVQAAPADARAMERIGTPAKGLPALEWLLWVQPLQRGTAECRYAERVAEAVSVEALALKGGYASALAHGWDASETDYALYEFLNLFDAGVQKLWWEDMARPQRKAATGAAPALARSASGHTVQAWAVHWQALRTLALGARDASMPSLHGHLVAKGQAGAAERLQQQVARVERAMAALVAASAAATDGTTPPPEQVEGAVAALRALQQLIETDIADALQFVISFFDEDGD